MSIRGDCRVVVAHDDVREQGYDNGRATSGGVIVVAVRLLLTEHLAIVRIVFDE